ncbi:MAG TPA: M23 family metallopeptidase [Sulfurimonas sp.]|nr:M23 family metallopeptidase [Sulfurimonas sp.]
MNKLFSLLLLPLVLLSSQVEYTKWKSGETFLNFLEKQGLPQKIYYNLDKSDQTITEEIYAGVNIQILKDSNESIEQVLIPISEELQLHIYKDKKKYKLTSTPIKYIKKTSAFTVTIEHSPYFDIVNSTGSKKLAHQFVNAFKNSLNFRRDLRKGDRLVMVYAQKYRFGKTFSMPVLQVAMIELRGKKHYIYLNGDGRYYDEKGIEAEGFMLNRPVKNARVSSGFTLRRYHPILRRYRAHLGVDYAARPGTPISAAGSGRIIFAGYTRGYGKLIKIQHSDGYMTLYAHQRAFRRGIKRGKYVKKGQTIGYVGSTGLSTGPHLHFGLYKNGHARNPARVIRITTNKLKGKKLKAFNLLKDDYEKTVELHLAANTQIKKDKIFDNIYYLNIKGFEPKSEDENEPI